MSEAVSSLVQAIRSSDHESARKLLAEDPALVEAYDSQTFGATPLIHAVIQDDVEMVDLLLDAGADIDQRSDWWAGSFGVLDHGNDSMAEHLIARGATLTAHAAARLGKLEELREQIDRNPEIVHSRGGDGQMPLHFSRTVEIADLLLTQGADIDARDLDHGSTAAQWLVTGNRQVAAHLIARGCVVDPFMLALVGDTERLGRMLADEPHGAKLRLTRERFPVAKPAAGHIYLFNLGEHSTLLHAAAKTGQAMTVAWLIESGCDPDARGGYDDAAPLHHAAWNGTLNAVEALLAGGANIDLQSGDLHRNEPLGWAIVSGAIDAVRLLIARGARIRDVHVNDAEAGVKGEFRQFNRNLPLAAWSEIARQLQELPPERIS